MTAQLELMEPRGDEIALAEHAAVIRALGKRVVGDVIEIGRRLTDAKGRVGHGGWLPWLKREFDWSEDTAANYMKVHKAIAAGRLQIPNGSEFEVRSLYLLSAKGTPDEAREAVIERAANGETLTHAQVKAMIDEARQKQDAEHKADLDRKSQAYERKIETLKEKAEQQVAQLREELGQSLTPDLVEKAIDEAIAPLKKKIERYEKTLENQKNRIPIEHAGPASAIRGALRHFAGSLVITPEELVKSQKQIAKLINQPIGTTLGDDVANAKTAIAWLRGFVKEMES